MSEANKRQVGGDHYKTTYEHWDLMLDFGYGVNYLVGQATKYVTRSRKKNGMQDLQKGLHFVNKLLENQVHIVFSFYEKQVSGTHFIQAIKDGCDRYAVANGLTEQEADFCELMVTMNSPDDLIKARDIVLALMEQWDREHPVIEATPVPLTDSNKHSDRVGSKYADRDKVGW